MLNPFTYRFFILTGYTVIGFSYQLSISSVPGLTSPRLLPRERREHFGEYSIPKVNNYQDFPFQRLICTLRCVSYLEEGMLWRSIFRIDSNKLYSPNDL